MASLHQAPGNCSPAPAQLAVLTAHGPHVTPVAYVPALGRFWVIVPRGSLKARALRRDQRCALLVGETAIVGVAEFATARHASLMPLLAARYAARNAGRVAGHTVDVAFALMAPPPNPVVVEIRPVEVDTAASPDKGPVLETGVVPPELPLVDRSGAVVVAFETAAGPLVLPAHWDAEGRRVTVPRVAGERVCVAFDASASARPSRLAGVLLRGRVLDEEISIERVTVWSGTEARTTVLAGKE